MMVIKVPASVLSAAQVRDLAYARIIRDAIRASDKIDQVLSKIGEV